MAVGFFEAESAVTLAPRESVMFASVVIDPSLSQKRALVNLLDRLPPEAQEQITDSLPEMFEDAFADAEIDYAKDVKPWLGGEVAAFVLPGADEPAGAVVIATKDPDAALTFVRRSIEREMGDIEEASHRGTAYATVEEVAFATVGDHLVVGTGIGVEAAIDASIDGSLSTDPEFAKLDGALTDDRLLSFYVDTQGLVDLAEQTRELSPSELDQLPRLDELGSLGDAFQQNGAGAVFLSGESVVFESVTTVPEGRAESLALSPDDADLLPSLPASTVLGAAFPNVGASIAQLLETPELGADVERDVSEGLGMDLTEDVLAWMQDATVFVTGEDVDTLAGGLVVSSDDPQATSAAVDQIADLLAEQQIPTEPKSEGGLEGFSVSDPEAPVSGTVLGGDRLVIAVDQVGSEQSSASALLGAGPRLGDDPAFAQAAEALGSDYAATFYVDITRAVAMARSAFADSRAADEMSEADPYLDILSSVVAGVREDGDLSLRRALVTTKAP
jgi:hypothetical protein